MEKLLEKIELLKKELNNTEQVKNIQKLNLQIKENKKLLNKIQIYNQTRKELLRQEILSDNLYKKYKVAETELNILILQINSKLNKINNKGKCNI